MGWIGCAIYLVTPKRHPQFLSNFMDMFFKDCIKNPQTTIALTFLAHIISGIDGVLCLKLYNKMHSYFSPSASGLLVVLRCTQPIDSGKKRLQVSIVIKATRQWMVLTPTMIRCKKSFLRLLPSFYVSIVPPASTTTWSSILTVDAQWKICRIFLAFQNFF